MNILITNDDGFEAAGIIALTEALTGLGRLFIVAPTTNKSGASSALSLRQNIAVKQISPDRYTVQGTPVDCVHLALTGDFLPVRPDFVVSGINNGANLGDDVLYSGTVSTAIEGYVFGISAMAFSLTNNQARHFPTAAAVARDLVERWIKHRPLNVSVFNVNIPDIPLASLCGYSCTRLGRRHSAKPSINQGDGSFIIGDSGEVADGDENTDFHAIANNKVSVTPLTIDMTAKEQLPTLTQWLLT